MDIRIAEVSGATTFKGLRGFEGQKLLSFERGSDAAALAVIKVEEEVLIRCWHYVLGLCHERAPWAFKGPSPFLADPQKAYFGLLPQFLEAISAYFYAVIFGQKKNIFMR